MLDARAIADRYARAVVDTIDAPISDAGVDSLEAPCGTDAPVPGEPYRYNLLHMVNVVVPPEGQDAALERVRAAWRTSGVTETEYLNSHTAASPGGTLRGRTVEGFGISVMSISPPVQITIRIGSPCLEVPPGSPTDLPPMPQPSRAGATTATPAAGTASAGPLGAPAPKASQASVREPGDLRHIRDVLG